MAAAAALLCLCGCGKEKTDTLAPADPVEQVSQERTEDTKEDAGQDETEPEVSDETLFAKAFSNAQVENNGSMFVRVANRVYYRVYSPRALELTTIGFPSIDEVDANHPSKLMYYDLDTDENVEVCELSGIGNLYATVDGICLDSYPDGTASTTLVDENGVINEHYLDGNIMDVSEDGRSVVIATSDDDGQIIPCVWRDGKKIGIPDVGSAYFRSLGFAKNSMIIRADSESYDKDSVYSYDEAGAVVKLGDIGPLDMETYTLSPIIEEMTPDSDGGYIVVSFRDGTANALVGWRVYSFTTQKAGSLELFDEGEPDEKFNYEYPNITINEKDEPVLSSHRKGEVYLSENTFGNLMCAVPGSDDVVIRKDYVYEQDEHLTYVTQIEDGHCFDGNAVFFNEVKGERSPDEDAGWRWAYELSVVDCCLIRFDDDHTNENGFPMSQIPEELRSAGWNKGEIEYDRLVGEWKAYSYNVEGEYRIAEQENGVNDEMIRFDENGEALIYHKNRSTGKITNEKPMHKAEPDEFMDGDYAFIYHSEDEDPLRAGVAYLSHDILKIYYLYHFDGNSTGWYEIRYKRVKE